MDAPTHAASNTPADAGPPPCLAGRIGFLLARGHLDALAIAAEVMEPDLTPKHFGCLLVVDEEGPLSQQALGERMRVDRTTVVAVVDELERRGFVRRRRNPDDRRAYALEVTPSGRRWLGRTAATLDAAEVSLLAALGPEEQEELHRLLRKLGYGREA
jgi:DNA-binding MarR family transcriptional regulator